MVANQLRQLRLRLSYSQLELSVAAEVSPAMVVAIERYGYTPGPDVRAKIAKALGVSESTLWPGLEVTDDKAR